MVWGAVIGGVASAIGGMMSGGGGSGDKHIAPAGAPDLKTSMVPDRESSKAAGVHMADIDTGDPMVGVTNILFEAWINNDDDDDDKEEKATDEEDVTELEGIDD